MTPAILQLPQVRVFFPFLFRKDSSAPYPPLPRNAKASVPSRNLLPFLESSKPCPFSPSYLSASLLSDARPAPPNLSPRGRSCEQPHKTRPGYANDFSLSPHKMMLSAPKPPRSSTTADRSLSSTDFSFRSSRVCEPVIPLLFDPFLPPRSDDCSHSVLLPWIPVPSWRPIPPSTAVASTWAGNRFLRACTTKDTSSGRVALPRFPPPHHAATAFTTDRRPSAFCTFFVSVFPGDALSLPPPFPPFPLSKSLILFLDSFF